MHKWNCAHLNTPVSPSHRDWPTGSTARQGHVHRGEDEDLHLKEAGPGPLLCG